MADFNWSRFEVRIPVKASPKDLYMAWATKKGLEHWFLRLAEFKTATGLLRTANEFVETGDHYKWLWHGWPDETVEIGTITSCNGKDQLSFTFGNAGDCTVSIKSIEGENMVELVQENIPADDAGMRNYHLGCKMGWTFYLANLKSVLEGGIDLRNKNEKIKSVINS
jgi:uncharacterized protein YndB with AHSA1/START domain